MKHGLLKSAALKCVSMGVKAPEAHIDRYVELGYLKLLLDTLEINCVLDVGANRGQFSRELRAIGYTGDIISFEPIPREFEFMSRQFEGDGRWRGHQMALGAENTTMTIHIPKLSVMSSLLDSVQKEPGMESAEVEVRRLDGLLAEVTAHVASPRIFLKMDTQGYDLQVLKGAGDKVSSFLGMQSELSVVPLYENMPHYTEALQTYEAAGFELYNLSVVNRVADGGLLELNCFMKRR